MNSNKIIIGIDGGGTKTEAVAFNEYGQTICKYSDSGSNLYVYKEEAVKLIVKVLETIVSDLKINFSDISALGCGLAGVSDLNSRDLLLKEFDRLKIVEKSIILSDTESAYQLLCPTGQGILVSVGTGIVCLGRDKDGKSFKVAGKGYDKGDAGSGYWIGKEAIKKLYLNQNILLIDEDMKQIYDCVKKKFNVDDLHALEEMFNDQNNMVFKVAALSENILEYAEKNNDIALSIIQEGTRIVAEYVVYLIDEMEYTNKEAVIAGNGSIIKNDFYRKCLNDALQFDISNLHWIFSDICCAYSSGIIAAQCQKINVSVNDIIKHIN